MVSNRKKAPSQSGNVKLIHPNRLKVIYVINAIKNSGPNQILNTLVQNINHDQFDVTIISLLDNNDQDTIRLLSTANVDFRYLNLVRKIDILIKGPRLLRDIFDEINPDVIHSHGILSDIVTRKANRNATIVSTVHSNVFEDYSFTFGRLKGYLYSRWHMHQLKRFDHVVCCSSAVRDAVKHVIPSAIFIRNGVDPVSEHNDESSILRTNLGIGKNDAVFVYIGSLSTRKNVIELLDSFSQSHSKQEHLLVIGNGELSKECEAYSSSNIHIIGFRHDVSKYLAISDVYVSASRSEGFSVSIIEALHHGLHLLISDIPSHREVMEIDNKTYIGELFTKQSFQQSKENLIRNMKSKALPRDYQNKYLSAVCMVDAYQQLYIRGDK